MRSDLRNKKILLVDDEPDIRDFLRWEFEDRGGQVVEAGSIEEGAQVFEKERPHFCLFDVRMPGGTGVNLINICKNIDLKIPMALMTGFTEISISNIYNIGACDVFLKPLKYELLFPRIDKEILPLENRFDIPQEFFCAGEITFSGDFIELCESNRIKMGRGGFCIEGSTKNLCETGQYYQLKFSGDQVLTCRLCWAEKSLKNDKKHFGFEIAKLPSELNSKVISLIQDVLSPAYIPLP